MQTHDLVKFTTLLAGLGELYGKFISEQLTDIYWQTLKIFDWQDVQHAFQAHLYNPNCGQFFPKPADIVRFIEGSGETRALRAWTIVEKTMHQVGIYQSVVFDDPLIHAVIEEMGGWIKLCSMTLEDLPFRSREFQKRYMGFVIKKPNRYPKYLYGLSECENAKNGYDVESPLLIGDAGRAERVMLNGGGMPLLVQPLHSMVNLLQQYMETKEEDSDESN